MSGNILERTFELYNVIVISFTIRDISVISLQKVVWVVGGWVVSTNYRVNLQVQT